jgi:hypothetical protein
MLRDLMELVRAPAALSVPGDAVAGATAAGCVSPRTAGLAAASVCLYWAGMAANDWADRELDAVERPERPIPSGRISASAALTVASGLTVAGVGLAAASGGKRALTVAIPLAAAIWSYDVTFKNSARGPAVMALCRGLDVLLGASQGRVRRAIVPAAVIAAQTYTVTELSRREVHGATRTLPAMTLAATGIIATTAAALPGGAHPATTRLAREARLPQQKPSRATFSRTAGHRADSRGAALPGSAMSAGGSRGARERRDSGRWLDGVVATGLSGMYAQRFGAAQRKALVKPTAENIRASVGAGIMALPALQGALTARYGRPVLGALVALGAAAGKRLAKRAT